MRFPETDGKGGRGKKRPNSNTLEGAKRDQALAKLFYRSGWTQEALAKAEGKGRPWITRHTLFGRFLENVPNGTNSEIPLSKLTEGRFRDYWSRTDKAETNERIRFRDVLRLIEESTLAAPRSRPRHA